MTKFALLSYTGTSNLGDEIQSIAAQQFLPRTDLTVDRDRWTASSSSLGGECKIILNGWFTHNPNAWPPPDFLSPCLVSLHITREQYGPTATLPPSVALVQGDSLAYFKRHQPVGGRDLWTTDLLKRHGVDSYFSGCVTLTLGAANPNEREDYICAVDLRDELYQVLSARTRQPILRLSHRDASGGTFEERCARASKLLALYAHARCVVTTRLHCALPCVAFGTPVLLINAISDQYRFTGLIGLVRNCSVETFKDGSDGFDLDAPAPNSGAHLALRKSLIDKLEAFTGYCMRPFQP